MINKTISFPKKVNGREVERDIKEIEGQIKTMSEKTGKKIGFGTFLITIYQEWRVMKARLDAMDRSKEYIPPMEGK